MPRPSAVGKVTTEAVPWRRTSVLGGAHSSTTLSAVPGRLTLPARGARLSARAMGGPVLIIDDDDDFTASVKRELEARGHSVQVEVAAGLERMKTLRPSVLMVNAELSERSGFSVCSRVRRDRELRGVPILLTSNAGSQEALDTHAARPERANLYALKPLAAPTVVDMLEQLIQGGPPPLHRSPSRAAPPPLTSSRPPSTDGEGPPPLLGAPTTETSAAWPAMPTTSASHPSTGRPETGPPPLRTNSSDLNAWPRARFDEAFDAALGSDMETGPGARRSGPEDRVEQLRTLVKKHEQREREMRRLFHEMNERGEELARRVAGVDHERRREAERVDLVTGEKADLQARLDETEQSFRGFHDEVTRIFTEKDAEERATLRRLEELEAELERRSALLNEAREHNEDDRRRLAFLQDELEELHGRFDGSEAESVRLREALERAGKERQELEARLSTTEAVAQERAESFTEMEERLDRQALDTERARARLEASYRDRLAVLEGKLDATEADHQRSLEAHDRATADLESAHAQQIETLEEEAAQMRRASEAERVRFERDHAVEVERLGHALAEAQAKAHVERNTFDAETSAAHDAVEATLTELSEARAELEALRESFELAQTRTAELESEVRTLATALDASSDTIDEMRASEEEAQRQRHRAEALAAELRDSQARLQPSQTDERVEALEKALAEAEDLSESHGEKVLELHARLDVLRGELSEAERRARHASELGATVEQLETSLRAAEQARVISEKSRARAVNDLERMRAREADLARDLAQRTGELEAARNELGRRADASRVLTLEALEADGVDLRAEPQDGSPFAALVDEIHRTEGMLSSRVRGGGALSAPPRSDTDLDPADEAEPGEVTEIIDLEKLKD